MKIKYTMKNISKYLGAGLLLFTAACSQTQEGDQYTPNKDDAKAIGAKLGAAYLVDGRVQHVGE